MAFQTRNEAGEIKFFNDIGGAVEESRRDQTVFKLSFEFNGESHRWRPKKKSEPWSESSERNLCCTYDEEAANSRSRYWVHQVLIGPNMDRILKEHSDDTERREEALNLDRLVDICTERDFLERFR